MATLEHEHDAAIQAQTLLANGSLRTTNGKDLSKVAKVTGTLSSIVFLALSTSVSTTATALIPVTLIPTAAFLWGRTTVAPQQRGSIETIFWIYLLTATVSTALLMVMQLAISYVAAYILFGSDVAFFLNEFQTVSKPSDVRDNAHRAARAEFVSRPSYWIFIAMLAFVVAGLCEEVQKYISLATARKYRKSMHEMEYLIYGATAGLAFATIEMFMFLVAAKEETGWKLTLTVIERLVIGMSAHSVCGLSIGLMMAKQDHGKADIGISGVLLRSTLCHGAVDFGLLAVSALQGNIGWMHPEDVVGSMCCLLMSASTICWLGTRVRADMQKLKLQ